MAKNSVFGSQDSYFGRIFDLSHFFGRNVNLSIRERKARYGAKNGQNEKKPGETRLILEKIFNYMVKCNSIQR